MRYLLYIVWIVGYSLSAQTFQQEMELVYRHFGNTANMSFNIRYILRESHAPESRILTENNGRYAKRDRSFISVYGNIASLVTPGELILINRSDKKIRVKKVSQDKNKIESPDFLTQLEAYNTNIDKVSKFDKEEKGMIRYRVYLKPISIFPLSHYDITIDVRTHFIHRLSLFYKRHIEKDEDYLITGSEIPRLDILFSGFDSRKTSQVAELDPAYYYVRNNKKVIPTQNFKGYDVKEIY